MATEYKLSYTANEIDRKLGKVDTLVSSINGISPDANGNVELEVNSNIATDTTLTTSGSAADAKATGDRLLGVEYQPVTTEEAYEHTDLPEGKKTVTINGDGTWGDTAYVCAGKDLIPRDAFNRSFPYNGISITREQKTYHIEGTSTASSTIYFGQSASDINIEVENIAGKTYKLITSANKIMGASLLAGIRFYDSGNNTVKILDASSTLKNQIVLYVGKETLTSEVEFSVPTNAEISYMRVYLTASANIEFDNDFQIYLVENENLYSVESTANVVKIENGSVDNVCSVPYSSVVVTESPLSEYIKFMTRNVEIDTVAGETTYVTPEQFGAKGNGSADDTEAVLQCIEAASKTMQIALMAKKYKISSPIEISDNCHLIANNITYTGTDTAIKIHGKRNTIKIRTITSSGTGVLIGGEGAISACIYNNIDINLISAQVHGVVLNSITKSIFQNTARFNWISAGGTGCYGIAYFKNPEDATTLGENNFYGGQITNCEWACYKIQGNSKFYGIHLEGNVQGGFYIEKGCQIFHPRIAESMRDGNLPIYKFIYPEYTTIYNSPEIYINQIDLSEAEDYTVPTSGIKHQYSENSLGIIYGAVIGSNIEDEHHAAVPSVYSTRTYIWGKYLIFTPHMAYRKTVTTTELDTRNIGKETDFNDIKSLPQLPTKFVVDNINSDIYLHPSYCAFGINEFEVEQANGFNCRIYGIKKTKDDNGDFVEETFIIFDGASHGDGVYKFKVCKDSELCSSDGMLRSDFLGHYWEAIKINTQELIIEENESGNFSLVLGGGE